MSTEGQPTLVDRDDPHAVLKAAEVWLSDPAHWTTKTCWRDAEGREITQHPAGRVRRTCLLGACSLVAGATYDVDWPYGVYQLLAAGLGVGDDVSAVNDGPDGYSRIMLGLRRAIEALDAQS